MATTTEKATKSQRILEHLQNGWTLDTITAMKRFGTIRLGGLIFHLRKRHNIETIIQKSKEGDSYAVYRYIGARKEVRNG